jgi:hypothetical protein
MLGVPEPSNPLAVSGRASEAGRYEARREGGGEVPCAPASGGLAEGGDEGAVAGAQLVDERAQGGVPEGPGAALEVGGPGVGSLGADGVGAHGRQKKPLTPSRGGHSRAVPRVAGPASVIEFCALTRARAR